MISKTLISVYLLCLLVVYLNATILRQKIIDDTVVIVQRTSKNNVDTIRSERRTLDTAGSNGYLISYCEMSLDANTTGWYRFTAWINESLDNTLTASSIGYNEGGILVGDPYSILPSYWENTIQKFCANQEETCKQIRAYIKQNNEWVSSMIAAHKLTDPYWYQVNLIYVQIEGMKKGYDEWKSKSNPNITVEDFWFMQLQGELVDLVKKFSKPGNETTYTNEGLGSAIVKLLPNNKDLLVGHNSWFGYNTMLRFAKRYELAYKVKHGSSQLIPSRSISLSGYPTLVHSLDDFYVTSAGLAVQKTSIRNYNEKLWEKVNPKGSVFEFVRATVANRLATDGKSWSKIFAKYNSGTSNSQWMVVDYNKFTSGNLSNHLQWWYKK